MDSDLYLLESPYLVRRKLKQRRTRFWVSPILRIRKSRGEFHHLHEQLKSDRKKFFDYYRMETETFHYILRAIQFDIVKWSNFREPILPEERLAVTLRYLATGSSFKTLGYSFRISDVTVGRIIKETCQEIWANLHILHIPFPKENQMKPIIEGFWEKWTFPNCVGCIDGKHVRIRNPKYSGSMYRNYKQYFSIVIQAVAGPDYKFIAIDVGAYGKESDGGIFSHSNLSKKLEEGAMGVKRHSAIPGTNIVVPNVILGDEAYPLKSYLMRPFPVSRLGPSERIFNKRLSKARQVIECAFGIMSSKWRLLLTTIEMQNPDDIDIIIKCICLLHNIVIDKEGGDQAASFAYEQTQTANQFSSVGENHSVRAAYSTREKFKTFFCLQERNG